MAVDVKALAKLAHLALSEEELATYAQQIEAILGYAARLDTIDTQDVPVTCHPVPMTARLREDVADTLLEREGILANAPQTDGDAFVVPKVV